MRRGTLLAVATLFLACTRERPAPPPPPPVPTHAPVILISVDTLRSDHLPAYGYRGVATPNIDELRHDSILFERAYSHCPMTLPSHASILTGLLPTEHGVRNNIGYRFDSHAHTTLASTLKLHGYATGAAVSSYVLRSETGINAGFDDYDDSIPVAAAGAVSEHQRSGFETLGYATRWIESHASRPFFYFFHIYEPHAPYVPPEPFRTQYRSVPYDGEIATADLIVGRFIARLKQLNVYDRALIVFLSDHGEGLWDHGEDQHGILLYRETLQVPLFIKLPRAEGKSSTVARPVQLADITPTILDVLGLQSSDRSLIRNAAAGRPIYSETLYPRIHLGWSELRSLIDGRNHYIDGPRAELYDIVADPRETTDRANDDRRTGARMKEQIAKFPAAIAPIERVDPEEAAKLAALGYVGTPQNRSGPLPNPRDVIGSLQDIKAAFALADQRRDDEAVRAFRALLEKNPGLQDVWSKLGETLVESGRYEEAIDTYKAAIAQSARFSPELALGLGFAYLKNDDPQEAITHAAVAVPTNPREAHELMARAMLQQQRYGDAEQQAQLAIEAGDRQPASILLLAEIQRGEGKLDQALQTISDAQRRANDMEVPHLYGIDYLRGDILARLDRPDEAIAAYKTEIAASPGHLQSYANLALIYFIEGKKRDGNATLELMAKRNPHRGAYALAAKTLDVVGEKQSAARWRARAFSPHRGEKVPRSGG